MNLRSLAAGTAVALVAGGVAAGALVLNDGRDRAPMTLAAPDSPPGPPGPDDPAWPPTSTAEERGAADEQVPEGMPSRRYVMSDQYALDPASTWNPAISRGQAIAIAARSVAKSAQIREPVVSWGLFTDTVQHKIGETQLTYENVPVWVVSWIGGPPAAARGKVPANYLGTFRAFINAQTGQLIVVNEVDYQPRSQP